MRYRVLSVGAIVVALAAGGTLLRAPEAKTPIAAVPNMPQLLARAAERTVVADGSMRPAYRREVAAGIDRVSPPAASVGDTVAVKQTTWRERQLPHLYPSEQLPFRYHVEQELAERFGLDAIIDAVAMWDGIAGSRWATEFAGLVHGPANRRASDGRSVLYLRTSCPPGWLGYAARNYAPQQAVIDARYGSAAIYTSEIDIGVCPRVTTLAQLRATLAHEVGHAMGLGHLCDDGHHCEHTDDEGTAECRWMSAVVPRCEGLGPADEQAARHLHPTLARLAGPTAADTAARVSYATAASESAAVVVLARAGGHHPEQVLAASLSGFTSGPLLLGEPDAVACLTGAARQELIRVARSAAAVLLVGQWPERCPEILSSWGLHPETLGTTYLVDTSLAIADRIAGTGRLGDSVTVVSLQPSDNGLLPGGVAAAAVGHSGPLLFSNPRRLSPLVADWLRRHPDVTRVYLMGSRGEMSTNLADALRGLGVDVVRLGGQSAVHTAAVVAGVVDLVPADGPVVVAAASSPADGAIAASLAARLHAPLFLTDADGNESVRQLLRARRPAGGYVVGGPEALSWELQWDYSRFVDAADHPLPGRDGNRAGVLLQSAVKNFFPDLGHWPGPNLGH